MHSGLKLMLAVAVARVLAAAEAMPAAQQNALVAKYCLGCHTDKNSSGGLSLEGFDAAHAAPSQLAMMLSKLKNGAMGASGIVKPEQATTQQLIDAFAAESKGAAEWNVERGAAGVTVSMLRELPIGAGETRDYRLVMSCNAAHEGFAQVAWSPLPKSGVLAVAVDGKPPLRYEVFDSGYAAVVVSNGLPMPAESIQVGELFKGESVTFPFATLSGDARRELGACFGR